MEGRCDHCEVEYPVHDLAGYDVRYGVVERALCYSCVAILRTTGAPGWFERLYKRVIKMKSSRPTTLAQHWMQQTMQEGE